LKVQLEDIQSELSNSIKSTDKNLEKTIQEHDAKFGDFYYKITTNLEAIKKNRVKID